MGSGNKSLPTSSDSNSNSKEAVPASTNISDTLKQAMLEREDVSNQKPSTPVSPIIGYTFSGTKI